MVIVWKVTQYQSAVRATMPENTDLHAWQFHNVACEYITCRTIQYHKCLVRRKMYIQFIYIYNFIIYKICIGLHHLFFES